jgi:carboxymethylenebutenolidase
MAILQTEIVKLEANGEGAIGYLARPDDEAQYPGVVLIQEWWGIEPHVREVAQRLATAGFVVLVPDLYHGKVATEPDEALKLVMMMRNSLDRAIGEITNALDYLKTLPCVEPKKLGIMGFCVGGFLTYTMASRYTDVGAVVPWYGGGYNPTEQEVASINAPILAFYGGRDESIPLEQVHKLEAMFKTAAKNFTLHIYPEAGHAFLNPDHGMGNEPAAKDAWPKAVNFLNEKLKKTS